MEMMEEMVIASLIHLDAKQWNLYFMAFLEMVFAYPSPFNRSLPLAWLTADALGQIRVYSGFINASYHNICPILNRNYNSFVQCKGDIFYFFFNIV